MRRPIATLVLMARTLIAPEDLGTPAGAVTLRGALAGAASSVTGASGAITLRGALTGTAASVTTATGHLTGTFNIAGIGASLSAATGALLTEAPFEAARIAVESGGAAILIPDGTTGLGPLTDGAGGLGPIPEFAGGVPTLHDAETFAVQGFQG